MREAVTDFTPSDVWWRALQDDVYVLQFGETACLVEAGATFLGVEVGDDGDELLRFHFSPSCPEIVRAAPETVQLTILSDLATTIYHLRVASCDGENVRVQPQPFAIQHRPLRRAPRTHFHLGPCPAVIHAADGQWRGVIEVHLHDVSAYGVGFKVELGRAYVLSVGDSVRVPITLPDDRRTYIEGKVAWLTEDGRGGIATRKPPIWTPAPQPISIGA